MDNCANLTSSSPVDAEYARCLEQLSINTVASDLAPCNITIDKTDPAKAYGYGFLMVAGICLLSLIGVLLLPVLKNNSKFNQVYPYANALLVALGTSALVCSTVFHLLPEVIQLEQNQETTFIWKGIVIVAGLYAFCLLEIILHSLNLDTHHDHGPSTHRHSPSCGDDASAESESDVEERNTNSKSVGNHDVKNGDLELRNEKSNLISDSKKAKSLGFSCRGIKPLAWTIIGGNIVHNFADGLTLGAAISQKLSLGVSAAIAIAFHEIPHELGNFAILISAGFSWYVALLINFMLATTSLVGFFLGVAVGTESHASTQWILALSVGLFLYVALVDLLPELIHTNERGRKLLYLILMTNIGFFISFTVIVVLALFKKQLNSTVSKTTIL